MKFGTAQAMNNCSEDSPPGEPEHHPAPGCLVLFVFLLGPTLFLLNLVPVGIVTYLDNMLDLMSRTCRGA